MDTGRATGELAHWLERDDLTLEDLVATAGELLPAIAPRQTRYKVTDKPDARTVRYYISQDLLPRPVSYEGGRARYSGSHLLRLLLVKQMQAEHHTLRRIARVLDGLSDEGLVAALGSAPPCRAEETAQPQLELPASSHRLELAPGGVVDVPHEVLRDASSRRKLAQNLRALARWLEATEREPGKGGTS